VVFLTKGAACLLGKANTFLVTKANVYNIICFSIPIQNTSKGITPANNNSHGFLRASDGSFATFDPPGRIAIFVRPSFTIVNYLHCIVMGIGSFAEDLIDPMSSVIRR
jgi:hypothetical protein